MTTAIERKMENAKNTEHHSQKIYLLLTLTLTARLFRTINQLGCYLIKQL